MRYILLILTVFSLAACVSTRTQHGYIIELGEEELTAQVGIDTKDSVLARYGEPSVVPSLNNDTWYYIATSTNSRAYYKTQTRSRTVVAFNFDPEGFVNEVVNYDLSNSVDIALIERETPTRGKELSVLEQLVGNVGASLPTTDGGGAGGRP